MKTIINFILIFLFLANGSINTIAQVVNIPDSILKDFLINYIPVIDLNGDKEIQISEAGNYTGNLYYSKDPFDYNCILECDQMYWEEDPELYECYQTCHLLDSNSFIHDITGIEAFSNVEVIYFQNIMMNARPLILKNLNNLSQLIIYLYSNIGNYDVEIDISNNINLREAYISQHDTKDKITLSNIDLTNSTNLWLLDIDFFMGLDTIDISTNTKLNRFNCNYNELSNIDLSKNTNLQSLEIYYNNLDTLELNNNLGLLSLICSGNNLENLDLHNNTNLVFLTCDQNKLTSLDLKNNPNIVEVRCSNNELSSLDFSNQQSFRLLNCSNNENLTYINLRNGNNVNFSTSNSDFENLPELETVCVDHINSNLADFINSEVNHDLNFTEDCTTSVNVNLILDFSVYPVPAKDYINIVSESTIIKKSIFNILGQTVIEKGLESKINISSLTSGVYYLKVVDENGNIAVGNFVKN
jgi:hypothetical protein